MNFGDDLLADLSDGSNDSFFDDPKPGPKRASLTRTPEKKSMTDIFNLTDPDKPKEAKKIDDWLGLDAKSPARPSKLSKKISFEDDDILGTMGLSKRPSSRGENRPESSSDTAKPPEKKLDLLESILGTSKLSQDAKMTKKQSFDDILKESKVRTGSVLNEGGEKKESVLFSDAPREGRRGRRQSGGLLDPLGLFSSEQKTEESKPIEKPQEEILSVQTTKSVPNLSTTDALPDWLGGGSNLIRPSKSENTITPSPAKAETDPIRPSKTPEVLSLPPPTNEMPPHNQQEQFNSILVQQKLSQSNVEYQNATIALQQQESQVLMALQLKKYEENLSGLQQKQQDYLVKQERQFSTLLERQFAKQQIMENNMRLQQERINNHIQMLIAQPAVSRHSSQVEIDEVKKNANEETIQAYENMISTLKQRQHEEMFLLEESYKKQMTLLEQSLELVEKRLKQDMNKISENFEKQIQNLIEQSSDTEEKYKKKIEEIKLQHIEEMKHMRENHQRVIDEIKYEHSTLIENIKENKKSESNFFSETSNYIQKLDTNIEVLFSNSRNLQEIKTAIASDYGILSRAREESLKAKEKEISLMKETLEKCRELAEQERAELLGLVRTLETKIAEQNQSSREERWTFQQAASTLAARSAALDRESAFSRASMERERDQIATLKQALLAEQERAQLQLAEQQLALAGERSRLETGARLGQGFDAQRARAEAEAAVQAAQEAVARTDQEREALQRENAHAEKVKRDLGERERRLALRECELDEMVRKADRREAQGERAVMDAKMMEASCNERLKELQNQMGLLASRERKLAEEKIALSRERLALNTMIRQTKRCGLCEADTRNLTAESEIHFDIVDSYVPKLDNMDNELLRLRLNIAEEEWKTSMNINN